MKKLTIFLFFNLFLLLGLATALPVTYYGNISLNNASVYANVSANSYVNGNVVSYSTLGNGSYVLNVVGDPGNNTQFFIFGINVANYTQPLPANVVNLNLNLSNLTTIGGSCVMDEGCASGYCCSNVCSASTCPVPSTPSSGDSSGGSGGGGSSTSYSQSVLTTKPQSKALFVNQVFRFIVKKKAHSTRVLKMGDDWAYTEVRSEPILHNFTIGESKQFDLDLNGESDLIITLENISNKKAYFLFKSIEPNSEEPVSQPVTNDNVIIEEPVVQPEVTPIEPDKPDNPEEPKIGGDLVECTDNLVENCSDGTNVITKACVEGKYKETGDKCVDESGLKFVLFWLFVLILISAIMVIGYDWLKERSKKKDGEEE